MSEHRFIDIIGRPFMVATFLVGMLSVNLMFIRMLEPMVGLYADDIYYREQQLPSYIQAIDQMNEARWRQ